MNAEPGRDVPSTVRRTVDVAASPDDVWDLVSDLPRMGEFSPENRGGHWTRGDGPAVGAVFRGTNRQGVRRWSTRCTVVECEPGRVFAFDVAAGPLTVSRWGYELEPTEGGCRLTETWQDRRGGLLRRFGGLTGVSDRAAYTVTSIEQTLARVKATAESSAGSSAESQAGRDAGHTVDP